MNTASQKPLSSTEQKILAAARQEFINSGLSGARLHAIADRAGVNKALLHYYFRSKQRLYESVLENILSHILSNLQAQVKIDDKETDIRSLVRTIVTVYITTFQNNPDFPRMMGRELVDGGTHIPAITEVIMRTFGHLPRRIMQTLQTGMKAGRLRTFNPMQVFMNIMGMCIVTFLAAPLIKTMHQKIMGSELEFTADFYAQRIDIITEMTCNGLIIGEKNK
jgi:AcrR family transcriptional regulator